MRPRSPEIPVPRPEIRGRGGAGESKLAAGNFEAFPYFPPNFGDGAGTEFLSPSGDGEGRGQNLYCSAGTGRGGYTAFINLRGQGLS